MSSTFLAENPGATPYDVVAYPGQLHAQTHPERLATIGRLFGLRPAPVTRCRVLELGCGNAENLIPMAWSLPGSEFTGIDLAGSAIQQGRALADHLGLNNCRLLHDDILKVDATWGTFDYIIAHGVYAWVPAAVQDQLLAICRQCLAPQGVGFISYNAYPGAHLSTMLREMMRYHTRGFSSPREQAQQAVTLVRLLAGPHALSGSSLQDWLQEEARRMLANHPAQVYHDELATVYSPASFTDFIDHARRHELQFVGEADFHEMSDHVFSEEARQALRQLAGDRIRQEQYRDFFKLRRFRQTLLTHAANAVAPTPDPAALQDMQLRLVQPLTASSAALQAGEIVTFAVQPRGQLQLDLPLGKAAVMHLIAGHPHAVPFPELLAAARSRLTQAGLAPGDAEGDCRQLSDLALHLCAHGLIRLHSWSPVLPRHPGERPTASPIARWQIRHGPQVTSLRHQSVQVEDRVGQLLIGLLDGTRDRAALVEALAAALEAAGTPAGREKSGTELRAELAPALDSNLQALGDIGLLVS